MVVVVLQLGGNGASSMTQSLRSIREDLCRGEGDAEREYVVGTIEGMDTAECECGRVEKSNESRRRRGIVRPTPFPNIFSRKISRLSSDASELHSPRLRGHVLARALNWMTSRVEPCDKKPS